MQDLEQRSQLYVRKMPFLKALILSELTDDVEVYKYIADDLEFRQETTENYLNGLRGGMNELYADFRGQFSKLGECQHFQVSVLYDKYFVRKTMVGKNVLLVAIAEAEGLDIGAVDQMCADFRVNLGKVDKFIDDFNKQQ